MMVSILFSKSGLRRWTLSESALQHSFHILYGLRYQAFSSSNGRNFSTLVHRTRTFEIRRQKSLQILYMDCMLYNSYRASMFYEKDVESIFMASAQHANFSYVRAVQKLIHMETKMWTMMVRCTDVQENVFGKTHDSTCECTPIYIPIMLVDIKWNYF